MLAFGLLLGSACLAGVLAFTSSIVPSFGDRSAQLVGATCLSFLAVGDLWSLASRRPLYPLTARRQTAQSLMFARRPEAMVGLLWGMDAGFGVATYRSTSGLWALSCLAILGLSPSLTVLGYGAGFAAALLSAIWMPTSGGTGDERAAAATDRIHRLTQQGSATSRLFYVATLIGVIAILAAR